MDDYSQRSTPQVLQWYVKDDPSSWDAAKTFLCIERRGDQIVSIEIDLAHFSQIEIIEGRMYIKPRQQSA